jgi:hypothetical protein
MRKIVLIVAAAMISTGCATVTKQPMAPATGSAMKDQTPAKTARPKPSFVAMTAGKAVFGMIGALAMTSAGNDIIVNNQVPDPADEIARGLADALKTSRGARITPGVADVTAEDPAALSAAAGGANYILDGRTLGWSFGYFPTDWSHYRVMYTAKARLIDTASKSVVAQGNCSLTPDSNAGAPTYAELIANNAARLKQELSLAGGRCMARLKTEMLAL